MRKCSRCGNFIPRDLDDCPHCSKIGASLPRKLFGFILLLISVIGFFLLSIYFGSGLGIENLPPCMLAATVITVPIGLFGSKFYREGVVFARAKKYKAHSGHDFGVLGYCKFCGESQHNQDRCRCQTSDIVKHTWDGCVCIRCGMTRSHKYEIVSSSDENLLYSASDNTVYEKHVNTYRCIHCGLTYSDETYY